MASKPKVKLDPSRLLGFRLYPDAGSGARTGAKIGEKVGGSKGRSTLGAKIGSKVGLPKQR